MNFLKAKVLVPFLFMVTLLNPGFAAGPKETPNLAQFRECDNEMASYCPNVKGSAQITECLIKNRRELSANCKEELTRTLSQRRQAGSREGGALSAFGGLNAMGPSLPLFSFDTRISPNSNAPFTENKMNLSAPIHKTEKETVSASLAGSALHVGNNLVLDTGKMIPADLYRIEVGSQYYHKLEDHRSWGLRGSLGFASDKPLQNSRDLTYSFSSNYSFPDGDKSIWILSLFYSNNSALGNFPLPGVSYLYKTQNFTGIFGFPFTSLQWTPVHPWIFSLSFFGPTLQSEVGYGSLETALYFFGFYWTRQSYLLADRTDDKDRLTFLEKKTALGIRLPIYEGVLGELQIGEAFGRSAYVAQKSFGSKSAYTAMASNWYLSAGIKAKF